MKKKLLLFSLLLTLGLPVLWGQTKIKDGTVTGSGALPNSNAILELESNNRGLLLPRVPLTSMNAATPLSAFVAGMVVYNTATAGSGLTAVSPGYYYSDGTSWVRLAAAGTVPLSSLVAAVSTNNIDNTNFAQVWNWSTAATETPFTLTGNALTTGSLLSLSSSSTGRTGTNGLLHVANTSAATTGMLASFRGNSADSGFNILNNGSIGVGTNSPNSTALVELMSTSKGFLIPRLTTAQRDAIGGPAIGLQIFNSDVNCLEYWNGTQWISMCGGTANGTANPDCASRRLYGVYQVGSATTGSNYVVIPVTVIKAGSWSATTTTANGLSFSGSGTFAAPGTDSIRIYAASGSVPVSNGSFTYTLTLGSSTCNFSIDYNSLPGCTTPTPALTATTVCTILQGSSRAFGVSGGTSNTTSFTYSITPTTGVSAPTGTVTSGATPSITFSNIGNYTITFTAKNTGTTCNEASISTTQSFQVVTGPAAASTNNCDSRFGPSAFTSNVYSTTIGGVSVSNTWTKTGSAANGSIAYNTCLSGTPAATFVSTSSSNASGITTHTFTFNQPVSNIQLITGADNGASVVVTARNGSTDVTSQLVMTQLANSCTGFSQTACNTFTNTSATSGTAGGFVIGGVYYTEFTVSCTGTATNGTDAPFDLSYCQAVTNSCQVPGAITTSYSPATNTTLGGNITATLGGGTPNTSNFSWTTSTLCGTYTGTTSGSNASTATFSSSSYAVIEVTYSVGNAGSGSCLPATTTKRDTLYFYNASPTAPTTASLSVGPVYTAGSYTFNNGSTSVTVTNNATATGTTSLSAECGITYATGTTYTQLLAGNSVTYTISTPVYNAQVLASNNQSDEGTEGIAIYAYLCNKLVPITLTAITQANGGGSCNSNFTISATTDGGQQVRNTGSTSLNSVVVTIASTMPYDKLIISRVSSTTTGWNYHQVLFNNASASSDCAKPTASVAYSSKIQSLGANITTTVGGANYTAVSWTATVLAGTYTGASTGTGNATLTSTTKAVIRVVYTFTNAGSNCIANTTTVTDTVSFNNLSEYLVGGITTSTAVASNAIIPFTQLAARGLSVSSGIITLKAGKTYRLYADIRTNAGSTNTDNYFSYRWVNAVSNVQLSGTNVGLAMGADHADLNSDLAGGGIYTVGSSDETIKLVGATSTDGSSSNTLFYDTNGQSSIVIEEIDAASGFVQAIGGTQTVTQGAAINWTQQVTRGNVTVSGSVITLKAGKTYRLFASLRKEITSGGYISYQFTNASGTTILPGTLPGLAVAVNYGGAENTVLGAYGVYTTGASDETISVKILGTDISTTGIVADGNGQSILIVDELPAYKGYLVGTRSSNQTGLASGTDVSWQVTSASSGGLSVSGANITLPAYSTYSLLGMIRQFPSSGSSGSWVSYNWVNSFNVALSGTTAGLAYSVNSINNNSTVTAKGVYVTSTASEVVKLRTVGVSNSPQLVTDTNGSSGFMIVQLD